MLTLKTPFSVAWETIVKYSPCEDAVKYFTPIAKSKATFGEAIASIPTMDNNQKVIDSWSTWVLRTMWDELDKDVKIAFINKIDHYNSLKIVSSAASTTDKELIGIKLDTLLSISNKVNR